MIVKFEHIRKVRPIADNINDEKRLLPYMKEVEALDLIPAIGAGLYKQLDDANLSKNEREDITTNDGRTLYVTNEDYILLLEGGFCHR
jgi:hypothetical protein